MTQKKAHKEAFCLMNYRCEECSFVEQIWNSRDGVTPFMVNCPVKDCDGMAGHFNWKLDRPFRSLPATANRVFVSMTREEAEEAVKRRIHQIQESPNYQDWPRPSEESIAAMIEDMYAGGGQPKLISVEDYQERIKADPGINPGVMPPRFARLYENLELGQILVLLEPDDFTGDPKITLRFCAENDNGDTAVVSIAIQGWKGNRNGWDAAQDALQELNQERAESIVRQAIGAVNEGSSDG